MTQPLYPNSCKSCIYLGTWSKMDGYLCSISCRNDRWEGPSLQLIHSARDVEVLPLRDWHHLGHPLYLHRQEFSNILRTAAERRLVCKCAADRAFAGVPLEEE